MLISFPTLDRAARHPMAQPAPGQWMAPLRQVRAYWAALCHDGLPPFRAQIDPRGIDTALGGAFIAERVALGVGRLRIAGMLLSDLAGCDPRGLPLSVLFEPQARRVMAGILDQVFDDRAQLDLTLAAERHIGRSGLEAQLVLLPLRSQPGTPALMLGCIVVSGDPGRRARRFHVTGSTATAMPAPPPARTALRQSESHWTVQAELAETSGNLGGIAEKQAAPQLRLVTPRD